MRRLGKMVLSTAGLVTVVVGLAACGSDDSSSPGTSSGASTQKAQPRVLSVVSNAPFPPFEEYKNGKPVGAEVELTEAMFAKANFKPKWTNQKNFDAIIPAMQAGRYDVAAAGSVGDSPERRKVLYNVNLYQNNYAVAGAKGVGALKDVCGTKVAIVKGASSELDATDYFDKTYCAGNPVKRVLITGSGGEIVAALRAGRADFFLAEESNVSDVIKKEASIKLVEKAFAVPDVGLAGIVVAKKNRDLAVALQKGLQAIIADGTYARVMKKWNLTAANYTKGTVNGEQTITG